MCNFIGFSCRLVRLENRLIKDDLEVVQPAAVPKIPHVPSELPSIDSTDNLIATETTPLTKAEGDAASLG